MTEEDRTKALVPMGQSRSLQTSIEAFSSPLAQYLDALGLPTKNVLYPIDSRKNVIDSLQKVIQILPADERSKAHYLTKFTVAVTAGLFDGALNYLWNETIGALRRLVLTFDIQYFYSVAEKVNSRYRNLTNPDDLDLVDDHDLLESCRRSGLLSDVNYKSLENVNYMRNHASAAHPTEHEIGGYEMLGWLETCLLHAITAEPDHSVVNLKRLMDNLRTVSIPDTDFPSIGADIAKQPQERIDDLLWTLFGMYTDPTIVATAKTNINKLAKYVWEATSEDRKYEVGAKYGLFRKNAEVLRKQASQEFLEKVGGLRYKDEDSLAGELLEKLDALKSAHFGINNFYNEYFHAKALESSLPVSGAIPRAARSTWVKVISICYVGNGYGYRRGVDESALPYYEKHLGNFTEAETVEFIKLFKDPEFSSVLDRPKCDTRARDEASVLKAKHANVHVQRLLDLIVSNPGRNLDKVADSADYRREIPSLPTFV